jgi:membrane-associated phospholipid phosphatase
MKLLPPIFSSVSEHAGLKLACLVGVGVWMGVMYFAPQLWPVYPDSPAPVLPVDHWVPFSANWAAFYQSVFFAHILALWLPGNAGAVRGYTRDIAFAYAGAAVAFWLYPTLSPRPDGTDALLYRWLIAHVDGPRNAFPSLHAALATLAGGYLWRHFRAAGASMLWPVALVLWWITLLYSTLATRQHRVLDLVAGVALAGLIVFCTRRRWRALAVEESALKDFR